MKDIRTIVRFVGIWGFIFLLAGCSSEEASPVVEPEQVVEKVLDPEMMPVKVSIGGVASYVTPFEELMEQTRAWTPPTGFVPYEDGNQVIHVAFTKDNTEPRKGFFFRSGDKWHMSLEEEEPEFVSDDYYLYGYLPYMFNVTFNITDYNGGSTDAEKNADYSKGAIITLGNVPTAISKDLCVAIGAKHGTDKEHVADPPGLRKGDFLFNFKGLGDTEAANNYVFMLFDHIYAGLRIRMRVHPDYNDVRTIKLKALKLNTKAGSTPTSEKNDITIKLKATDGSDPDADPIDEIIYTAVGAPVTDGVEFWSSANGEPLGIAYTENIGHFMPLGVTTLVLTSVYDVYDKKGNLIREDSEATNAIPISELLTGQTTTRRDCRYTINMTIQPTYLYMLSDPDLDSPSVDIDH